nr:hypothetical protein [Tanacetum cinerariifolium]
MDDISMQWRGGDEGGDAAAVGGVVAAAAVAVDGGGMMGRGRPRMVADWCSGRNLAGVVVTAPEMEKGGRWG